MIDDGVVLECCRDMIDVTSSRRPDTSWKFADSNGHVHRWYDADKPVTFYRPSVSYSVPSIKWVKDGIGYYPDSSEYEIGHYECILCGETVEPGYTADTVTQYIPGLTHYLVNGQNVSKDELMKYVPEGVE